MRVIAGAPYRLIANAHRQIAVPRPGCFLELLEHQPFDMTEHERYAHADVGEAPADVQRPADPDRHAAPTVACASSMGSDGSNAMSPSLNTPATFRMLNPIGAGVYAPGTRSWARTTVDDADSGQQPRSTHGHETIRDKAYRID